MSVTVQFVVDLDPGLRCSTNDPADNQLIFADHTAVVTFEVAGAAWAPPTGSTWELVVINREAPVGGVLCRSTSFTPAPDDLVNVLTFVLPTNTVELRDYLDGARGRQVILEMVRTDLTAPQTEARWTCTAWNQGYDPNTAIYSELKHKSSCSPDRDPLPTDDETQGYGIGSIWVHCAGNEVFLCTDATAGAAVWRCWFDSLLPSADLGTSVPTVTSRLPVDSTARLAVGMALEVVQGGVSTWHMVTALAASYVEVMGPPLIVGTQVDMVRIMPPVTLLNMQVTKSVWDNSVSTTLLRTIEKTGFTWEGQRAHVVGFRCMHMEADATTQGTVQVLAGGSRVSTTGVVLSSAGTWVDNGADAIDKATYTVDRGDAIELECSAAGAAGTGRFLTVKAVIVLED